MSRSDEYLTSSRLVQNAVHSQRHCDALPLWPFKRQQLGRWILAALIRMAPCARSCSRQTGPSWCIRRATRNRSAPTSPRACLENVYFVVMHHTPAARSRRASHTTRRSSATRLLAVRSHFFNSRARHVSGWLHLDVSHQRRAHQHRQTGPEVRTRRYAAHCADKSSTTVAPMRVNMPQTASMNRSYTLAGWWKRRRLRVISLLSLGSSSGDDCARASPSVLHESSNEAR